MASSGDKGGPSTQRIPPQARLGRMGKHAPCKPEGGAWGTIPSPRCEVFETRWERENALRKLRFRN